MDYIALDLVVLAALWLVSRASTSKPWPELVPRPFQCAHCSRAYTTGEVLSLHLRGMHPDTFDR